MIKGIEILSQSEVGTDISINWAAFGAVLGLSIILGVVCAFWCFSPHELDEWIVSVLMILIFVIIGVVFGVLLGYATGDPVKYETQYKVTISDEVQMNEFLEKYEIIDQDGKIYTIREKGE